MSSIFTKIINGEIPSHKIAENENFYAFLDVFPLVQGHTLVVPKQEIDYMFDLPDSQLGELHIFSKKIAKAIKEAIPCRKIGTAVIGLEVSHAHLHLVPINSVADLNFAKPKLELSQEELAETAALIRSKLD